MNSFRTLLTVTTSVTGLCVASVLPGAAAHAAPADPIQVVASGFAGPLHLAVAPNRQIYVADAFLGQIDRVDPRSGRVTPVVTGLDFSPGVDVHGGQIFFTSTVFGEQPSDPGSSALFRSSQEGDVTQRADLLAYELAANPDGQPHQQDAITNPYGVLALPGRTIIADAAGNALNVVSANGTVSTLTVFPVSKDGECASATNNGVPNGGCDPVPTDVELGPDGFLYVSGLGAEVEGFLWKVDPSTGQIVHTQGGLPPLTGIAVADDGTVYVASLFTNEVFRFSPGGAMATAAVPGPTDVEYARGVLYAGSVDFSGQQPGRIVTIGPAAF